MVDFVDFSDMKHLASLSFALLNENNVDQWFIGLILPQFAYINKANKHNFFID